MEGYNEPSSSECGGEDLMEIDWCEDEADIEAYLKDIEQYGIDFNKENLI